MGTLRRDLASGFVIVGPIAISAIAVLFIVRWIAGAPLVQTIDPWYLRVPIVLSLFAVLVMSTGYLMRTALGHYIAASVGALINRIPVLRIVYNASQLAIETALEGTDEPVEPVRLESWDGLRVTAFSTGNRTADDRLVCFFPTAPNITTGYVIEVEEADLHRTGETVEQALMRILSAGFGDRNAADDRPPVPGNIRAQRVHGVEIAISD